jgi:hypothetical protein
MVTEAKDPGQRETLSKAMVAAEASGGDEAARSEARRALIRTLLAVDPTLPLDEFASEEAGVSRFYGRDALYVTDRGELPKSIIGAFEKTEIVAAWEETRRGLPLRMIRVYACHRYRSLPL